MPVLYASSRRRSAAQAAGDLVLLVWIATCWIMATFIRDAILRLADTGRQLSEKSDAVATTFDSAATRMSELPLLGQQTAEPFRRASGSIRDLALSGSAQADDITRLAWWTFAAVLALPVAAALLAWLPRRVRFVREATASRRFVDADADLELFALRAMAHQPLYRLARISPDPVGAYRQGDLGVIRELARMELSDSGLPMPKSHTGRR